MTANIRTLLSAKFCAPEYAILFEVRNATGHVAQERYADAIAMGLWPSRGMEVIGFEFKTYRSDWLRELKNPAKADAIFAYCDRWWIVAPPDVVLESEVPSTWGFMVATERKLRTIRDAPPLSPIELQRKFVASMLRRAQECSADKLAIDAAVNAALKTERAQHESEMQRIDKTHKDDLARVLGRIQQFENASGLAFTCGYGDPVRYGERVRRALDLMAHHPADSVVSMRELACDVIRRCDATLAMEKHDE